MNKHITLKWLEEQGACGEGKNWFALRYPNGVGHKELYAALQSEHKNWGYWLLTHIGGPEFMIRCALKVYKEPTWVEWANKWLSGEDRTTDTFAASAAIRTARAAASVAAFDPTIDLLAILDECEEREKVDE